jgi:hypothetical protein
MIGQFSYGPTQNRRGSVPRVRPLPRRAVEDNICADNAEGYACNACLALIILRRILRQPFLTLIDHLVIFLAVWRDMCCLTPHLSLLARGDREERNDIRSSNHHRMLYSTAIIKWTGPESDLIIKEEQPGGVWPLRGKNKSDHSIRSTPGSPAVR